MTKWTIITFIVLWLFIIFGVEAGNAVKIEVRCINGHEFIIVHTGESHGGVSVVQVFRKASSVSNASIPKTCYSGDNQ